MYKIPYLLRYIVLDHYFCVVITYTMAAIRLIPSTKNENVPVVGRILIDRFITDQSIIKDKYPTFDAPYLVAAEALHTKVFGLINPFLIIAKQTQLTQEADDKQDFIIRELYTFEGYLNRAEGLSVDKKNAQLSAIRTAKNKRNVEGVIDGINKFVQFCADGENSDKLQAKGMKKDFPNTIADIGKWLLKNKSDYAKLEQQKNDLVNDNHEDINKYWKILTDICDAGKRTFKGIDDDKVAKYTMEKVKAEVSRDLKLNALAGNITFNGVPVLGATIELLPLTAGRRRTGKSKKTGNYSIESITPGKYILNVITKKHPKFTTEIEIEPRQTLTLNVELNQAV